MPNSCYEEHLQNIDIIKADLIAQIDKRLEEKNIEPANAELLKKLIFNAESINEAIMIAELGTTYKRTGFYFNKKLEKHSSDIKYLKKNEALSFENNPSALTHKLIIGDNYDALQQLLITHRGMIDVIYIDPPYGSDSMGQFAKTNYNNAITRDNLLSMLYPRLQLAKQLMSDDALIFCSIDDKNQAYVKGLFDEVFGECNFITNFIWQKKKGGGQAKYVYEGHEYILAYAKNKHLIGKLLVNDNTKISGSKYLEKDGQTYFVNDDFIRAVFGKYEKGTERRCHYEDLLEMKGQEKLDEVNAKLASGEYILRESDSVKGKHYVCRLENVSEGKKKVVYSIISGIRTEDGNNEAEELGLEFKNPKPIALIKQIINLTQKKNATILDFFAGSGTTGQAVMELNKEDGGKRQFILCTNNEITNTNPYGIAYDVTSKRLKRVMTGKCYDGSTNFKWLEKNEPYGDNLDVYDIVSVNEEKDKGK